jgi:hypothetical protein
VRHSPRSKNNIIQQLDGQLARPTRNLTTISRARRHMSGKDALGAESNADKHVPPLGAPSSCCLLSFSERIVIAQLHFSPLKQLSLTPQAQSIRRL